MYQTAKSNISHFVTLKIIKSLAGVQSMAFIQSQVCKASEPTREAKRLVTLSLRIYLFISVEISIWKHTTFYRNREQFYIDVHRQSIMTAHTYLSRQRTGNPNPPIRYTYIQACTIKVLNNACMNYILRLQLFVMLLNLLQIYRL